MHEPGIVCENCGYPIEGFSPDDPCPECGTPVRHSMPGFRPGTPTQKQPHVAAWFATATMLLGRPKEALARMRFDPSSVRRFEYVNIAIGATGVLAFLSIAAMRSGGIEYLFEGFNDPIPTDGPARPTMLLVRTFTVLAAPVILCLFCLLVYVLTTFASRVVSVAIRIVAFLSRRRMSSEAAQVIAGHASLAWVLVTLFGTASHVAAVWSLGRGSPSLVVLLNSPFAVSILMLLSGFLLSTAWCGGAVLWRRFNVVATGNSLGPAAAEERRGDHDDA